MNVEQSALPSHVSAPAVSLAFDVSLYAGDLLPLSLDYPTSYPPVVTTPQSAVNLP